MKRQFSVTITETLKHTVTVKAKSSTEAIRTVSDDYYNNKYILSADDFNEVIFETN